MPWTAPKASSTARGYGAAHARERARWQHVVDAGMAFCTETVCVMPDRWIPPGTPWHLAHDDDRQGYKGASHPRCNIRDGAVRAQQRSAARRHHSRNW